MPRWAVEVSGVVQGVGFRPFVHALASEVGLAGFVANAGARVRIEVEGAEPAFEAFAAALTARAPVLAQVSGVEVRRIPETGEGGFVIRESDSRTADVVLMAPDVATCEDCLREIRDPTGRRFGYAFTNCTRCGPRLSVITGSPYDRAQTTLAAFPMCERCRHEYEDPNDRRFHAEPIACADCGPKLERPLQEVVACLLGGGVVALKSLGGYQLACDARSDAAVARLRERKLRDDKPFAVMLADAASAERELSLDPKERALLESRERPIVLCRRRPDSSVSSLVAPGLAELGVLLPYTPLHDLLMRAVGGIPLVMTSGNRSEEPMATEDEDARARLSPIADLFLAHDRPIAIRVDDSVLRVVAGAPLFLRRARGYAPRAVRLPLPLARPTLAVGGQLKNVFALGIGELALPSAHIGDLDDLAAQDDFERMLALYRRLFGVIPERVVCDLHPDYVSTQWAMRFAEETGAELVAVQHHHAHFASALCDAEVTGPAIGVTFDGVGLGHDGAAWGGEFLVGDACTSRRAAHLTPVGMPGGDRAAREPWRMGVAHLLHAGVDPEDVPALAGVDASARRAVAELLRRNVHCPVTSSVGRLFDAVAALAGGVQRQSFEGQAAMGLEALASSVEDDGVLYELSVDTSRTPWILDSAPMFRALAEQSGPASLLARRFHESLAEATARTCEALAREHGTAQVVLSGGVFVNRVLTESLLRRLPARGLAPRCHRRVPPNDGGLALGQLHALAARDAQGDVACA
ncbi:MAG: carbamoyltransferase HypF [Myxococcales bacterium]|nr:carbamoyltransferase HypF [Myxococcales bacterium]